jgi:hypothetical protein
MTDEHYDDDDVVEGVCRVGGHRHRGTGGLCPAHVTELTGLITGVARMTSALGHHLMPGSSAAGEKVSTTRTGSPTPARLDVLSLIGPGVTEVRRDARSLVPQIRRWSTVTTYDVHTIRDGTPTVARRQLRQYHVEMLVDQATGPARACRCGNPHADDDVHRPPAGRPRLVLLDDQVGAVPPAEWCDMWVRRWRLTLQHHHTRLPAGRWVDYGEADQAKRLTRAAIAEQTRIGRGVPPMLAAVAAYVAVAHAYAQHARRVTVGNALLGIRHDGQKHTARVLDAITGGGPPPICHDTAAAEWSVRYGTTQTAATVEVDAQYLTTWLPLLAEMDDDDDHLGLAEFAAELRALHRELEHVLGETRDEQWLGRCPAHLVDPRTGDETGTVCGAGLWHDPHRTGWRIECPRCHSSWPEREWLALAAKIRYEWPIDPRRRYTLGDRKAAERNLDRLPTCRGCERTMSVDWRPAPERGDRQEMWRPTRMVCPQGCLAGGTAVAA